MAKLRVVAAQGVLPLSGTPSAELRRIQKELRQVVDDDAETEALASSVAEGIRVVGTQIDRIVGLQELFEWYQKLPM